MPNEIPSDQNGEGLRIAVIVSRFNVVIGERLLEGALGALETLGVDDANVDLIRVPGAFELPAVAHLLAGRQQHDAVICLGAVVRGETPHFDYVSGPVAHGLAEASASGGVPVLFGVLTTDTMEQAMERSGGAHGNKGFDAARGAVEMANLFRKLRDR